MSNSQEILDGSAKQATGHECVECPKCHVHFMTPELAARLSVPSETKDKTYDVVADAVNEIADAAHKAFMDFHGFDAGCWDSDNVVQDVKRGIVSAIEHLPRMPMQALDEAHAIGFREGQNIPSATRRISDDEARLLAEDPPSLR